VKPGLVAEGGAAWKSSKSSSVEVTLAWTRMAVAKETMPSREAAGLVGCGGASPGALVGGERAGSLLKAASSAKPSKSTSLTGAFIGAALL